MREALDRVRHDPSLAAGLIHAVQGLASGRYEILLWGQQGIAWWRIDTHPMDGPFGYVEYLHSDRAVSFPRTVLPVIEAWVRERGGRMLSAIVRDRRPEAWLRLTGARATGLLIEKSL